MITMIGSAAMQHHFPDYRRRPNSDVDLQASTQEEYDRIVSADEEVDIFFNPALAAWDWGLIATAEELYTMKVSHSFWEIGGSSRNWQKHMDDIVFLQRKGVKFNRDLYDILYPMHKEMHGKKRTSLAQGVAFDAIERWRRHPSHDKYEVSNFGRLRGPRGISEGAVEARGLYRQFTIGGKTHLAHKIVAETWLGSRPDGEQIRHLDGNGLNNRVVNLEYGTPMENAADKDRHGTTVRHEAHPLAKLTLDDARKIRSEYATGKWTQRGLAKEYDVAQSLIGRIIQNRAWPEKQGFFDDGVNRRYIHDSIHASVAYFDEPLFKRILADGEEVAVDSSKFWAMDEETKHMLVREEIYATALERILIPRDYKYSPMAAYAWAAQRTVTSLFKGEWALYLVLNWEKLCRPDVDYRAVHLSNMDKLIPLKEEVSV